MTKFKVKDCLWLYGVTDKSWLNGRKLHHVVEEAIIGGATMIQYREKEGDDTKLIDEAIKVREVCSKHGIPLIINNRVGLAKDCQADGVHLGQSDMDIKSAREILGKDVIIGATVKTLDQALKAQEDGADYLGSGAVFGSTTKLDTMTLDHDILREICKTVSIPVVGIGGISECNISKLEGLGLDGVALVSSLFNHDHVEKATKSISQSVNKYIQPKTKSTLKTVLTIAGSDSSGGAGIQADLKTMTIHGVYGMTAITALTAQNTQGVSGISEVEPEFVGAQLDAIFQDIPPQAIKIGMVASPGIIHMIADKLIEYKATSIVLDPVMVSTSGSPLISVEAKKVLEERLFPLASLITPNIPEAEVLCGFSIASEKDMVSAAKLIAWKNKRPVLIKGGHFGQEAKDLLYDKGREIWLSAPRIPNANTHGTGCTLSSAIASNLAKGYSLVNSVRLAKNYIQGAIEAGLNLGQGSGPLNHMYWI